MRWPIQLSGIRAIAAVTALAASMALPLRTVRAQVMTNFPPLGELPPIHLQIERTNDQRLKLQWSSVPWASYLIQCKSNLADSQWKVVGHWMEADSEISSMETEVPTGSSC